MAHPTFADFWREFVRCLAHTGSTFSGVGASGKPGAVHGAKKILLGASAIAVLAAIPRVVGNPYVIVGAAAKTHRADLKRPWKRVTMHAGLADLRLHDLRHSYASMGAASGMGLAMVGKLLGHASTTTTSRYAHFADDPTRRASDLIADAISSAMGGDNQKTTAEG